MNLPVTKFFLAAIAISFCIAFGSYLHLGKAVLFENGTCTNEYLSNSSNQTVNTNGTVGDFLKSLPSDNTILAELVCNRSSNETK
jgi:hypothetical protein